MVLPPACLHLRQPRGCGNNRSRGAGIPKRPFNGTKKLGKTGKIGVGKVIASNDYNRKMYALRLKSLRVSGLKRCVQSLRFDSTVNSAATLKTWTRNMATTQETPNADSSKQHSASNAATPITTKGKSKTPAPLMYEDAQGPPMFKEENGGVYLRAYFPNDTRTLGQDLSSEQVQQMIIPLPERIPVNRNDTLYTYTKRVHKASVRTLRSIFRAQLALREQAEKERAEREVAMILERKKALAEWKAARRERAQKKEAMNRHKQAIEITKKHEEGMKKRRALEEAIAERQRRILLALVEERRKHWILNPDTDIRPDIFERTVAPAGWWPEYDAAANPHHAMAMAEREAMNTFITSGLGDVSSGSAPKPQHTLKDYMPQNEEEEALVELENATTEVVDYFARRALHTDKPVLPSVELREKVHAAIEASRKSGKAVSLDEVIQSITKSMVDDVVPGDEDDAFDDLLAELDDLESQGKLLVDPQITKTPLPHVASPVPGLAEGSALVTPETPDSVLPVGGEGTLLSTAAEPDAGVPDDVAQVESRVRSLSMEERAKLQAKLPLPIDEIISRRKRAQQQFVEARDELTVLYSGMFDPELVAATRRELSAIQAELLELRILQHTDPEAFKAKIASHPGFTQQEIELVQRYERAVRRALRKRDPFHVDEIDVEIAKKGYPRHELAEAVLDASQREVGGTARLPEQLAVHSKVSEFRNIKPMPTHEEFIMSIVEKMPIAKALRDAGKEVTYENVINSSLAMQKHQEAWDHARVLNNAFYEKARILKSKAEYYAARPDYNSIRMLELLVPEQMLPFSRKADAERLDLVTRRGSATISAEAPIRLYEKGPAFEDINEQDRAEDEAAVEKITKAVSGETVVDDVVRDARVFGQIAPAITSLTLGQSDVLNKEMPSTVQVARDLLAVKHAARIEAEEYAKSKRRGFDDEEEEEDLDDLEDGELAAGGKRRGSRRMDDFSSGEEQIGSEHYSDAETAVSTGGGRQRDVIIDKDGNEILSRRD